MKTIDAPPAKEVEAFFILDLDRCLVDTDKLHQLFESIVERETSLTAAEIASARRETEQAGETFDTMEYIHQLIARVPLGPSWHQLIRIFVREAAPQNMLEPYAKELLTLLGQKQIPHGIITYGAEAWQLAKLEATGLIVLPHLVTAIKEKGILLAGWEHDGVFIIPAGLTTGEGRVIARSITFLDDKPVSFGSIPPGVQGIHVLPVDKTPLPSQKGPLPAGVIEVMGLQAAAEAVFTQPT